MRVLLSLLLAMGLVSAEHGTLRSSRGVIQAMEFKNTLRICNAFAYEAALTVLLNSKRTITGNTPMGYKNCRDFVDEVGSGDKLEFRVGDSVVGTFAVAVLPPQDSVLLLVIHRRDTHSTAVAFESHIFPVSESMSQIAVLDTFKGSGASIPVISDVSGPGKERSEEVRFQSVLSVSPGEYEMRLDASDHVTLAKERLVVLPGECYVVLRTGIAAYNGQSYPQEMVVFPESDPAKLPKKAGAPAMTVSLFAFLALAACW